ncbi:MAG: hypothetical protein MI922_10535 [Bacteroidales bacterium]|nr:hypothetical protein [Bacteroidales bacterium]
MDKSFEKQLVNEVETKNENSKSWYQNLIEGYYQKLQGITGEKDEKSFKKHRERGKLLARERINLLIDEYTEFIEFSALASIDQYDNQFPSAGIITGIGIINEKPTVIVANDATCKGGTYIKETIKKHTRAQEIAKQNHLPCVYLVDSGGIYLPQQADVFPDRFDFGRIFYNQAQLSAMGLPQIAIVMGSCTAGGAYIPAMCDETIIVRQQGTIFIGGPPLVKAATGEEVTAEELGGGDVHAKLSGVVDYLVDNDVEALKKCREIFLTLNTKKIIPADNQYSEPNYPVDELLQIVPEDEKQPINAYEVLNRIVDGSHITEFKKEFGKTLVTAFATIHGQQVGILINNGFLTSEASLKGAHFIELCEFRNIPLVFFQNITGFIVGKTHEHKGIARDGAKLVHAVATSTVPKITIVFGGSYGAGNYAMAGRAFDPNFLFMWPNAKISVMGGEQAQQVLNSIGAKSNNLKEQFIKESSVYYSTSRIWDDGVIDPRDTRRLLGMLLQVVENKKEHKNNFGIFRM